MSAAALIAGRPRRKKGTLPLREYRSLGQVVMLYDRIEIPRRKPVPISKTQPLVQPVAPPSPQKNPSPSRKQRSSHKATSPVKKSASPSRQSLPQRPTMPQTVEMPAGAEPKVRDFATTTASISAQPSIRNSDPQTRALERREAVLRALEILSSVSRGLWVPDAGHAKTAQPLRVI